jgi:hypothetical protein
MLTKLEFSRQVFEKYSNIKFHENPSSGSRVVPCGQADGRTDGREEANSRSSKFCERTKKLYDILFSPVINMMAVRSFSKIDSFHVDKILCTSWASSLYERSATIAGSITSGINYNSAATTTTSIITTKSTLTTILLMYYYCCYYYYNY